jgi:hypothetical protein
MSTVAPTRRYRPALWKRTLGAVWPRRRHNHREPINEQLPSPNVPPTAVEAAPGVMVVAYPSGYGDHLRITWVSALRPGSGDVGRWLDTLPSDQTIWVSAVVSPRLAGMLARRGFIDTGRGNMVRRQSMATQGEPR